MTQKAIPWGPAYAIGIIKIDEQHQKLFEMVNIFLKAKAEGKEDDVLKETLTFLIEYTNIHFSDEESHMEKNRYYAIAEHKRQHKILINQVVNILENLKEHKPTFYEDLLSLFKNWLAKHIIDHDKQYGNFLLE